MYNHLLMFQMRYSSDYYQIIMLNAIELHSSDIYSFVNYNKIFFLNAIVHEQERFDANERNFTFDTYVLSVVSMLFCSILRLYSTAMKPLS